MARVYVTVCLSCLVSVAVVGQAGRELFRDATSAADALPLPADAVRQRLVTIDPTVLPASADAGPAQSLVLNLFGDVRLAATRSSITRTQTGYVWVGQIPTIGQSAVRFAVAGGVASGSVVTPDADFTIRYAGDGVYAIRQLNRTVVPPEIGPVIPDAGDLQGDSRTELADDGSVIDVLVVYTPAARAAQNGTDAMEALIELGISETNQAYATSGAVQQIRLVHTAEVTYTEAPGNMSLDLSRLRDPADGQLDVVHSLRNTYGADLVHLIVNNSGACGIAYLMTSVSTAFAPWAFGVTEESCISPNYSFAHELGHNMGLHHDLYVTGSETGAFAYSRGYVNQAAFAAGAPSSKRWRDIMAYNNQCADSGFNCTRLLAFSSPLNTHSGDPMGNAATADAVRSLNETRVTVSNFRSAVAPSSTFSVSDAAITEGNSGSANVRFTISLSPASASATRVTYTTADGTATSGSDYVGTSGEVALAAGATSSTVDIAVNGDVQFELPETFSVTLSDAVGAAIADGVGTATIKNDDFTDHPLAVGVFVKTVHVNELRSMINAVRTSGGMASITFAETLIQQVSVVRASHVAELRSALPPSCSPGAYTDPVLTAGATTIKAAHIAEIRAAVLACQ